MQSHLRNLSGKVWRQVVVYHRLPVCVLFNPARNDRPDHNTKHVRGFFVARMERKNSVCERGMGLFCALGN